MENSKHNSTEASYQPFHMEAPYNVPSVSPAKQRIAALGGVHPEAGKTTTDKGEQIAVAANRISQEHRDSTDSEVDEG